LHNALSMRLLAGLLFVALTGSVTLADEAAPPPPEAKPAETDAKAVETQPAAKASKVPFRVVRMLPETHQVLLLHKNRGSHVVAEVGQDIDGYIVDEIDGDEVTLVAPSGAEIILTAPDTTWRRRAAERKAAAAKTKAPETAAPVDPYADEDPISMTPDGQIKVRVSSATPKVPVVDAGPPAVTAPADPYASTDDGFTAFAEAVGAPAAPAEKPAQKPATKPADAGVEAADALAAAATGTPAPKGFSLSRGEVDAALADFGATAVTFDARFVAEGLRIDAIAKGTLLEKAGLVKGDIITAVDGKPLRSFDDAADLYARLPTAKAATVVVQRAGKPVTLKVAIASAK